MLCCKASLGSPGNGPHRNASSWRNEQKNLCAIFFFLLFQIIPLSMQNGHFGPQWILFKRKKKGKALLAEDKEQVWK